MKISPLLLSFIFLMFINISTRSQFGYIGPQVGLSYFNKGGATPAFGFTTVMRATQDAYAQYNFSYHPGLHFEGVDSAYAIHGGSNIPVNFKNKMKVYELGILGRGNLGGNDFSDGGLYIMIGFALELGINKITMDPIDEENYSYSSFLENQDPINMQLSFQCGLGYEKVLGNDHYFGGQFIISLTHPKIGNHADDAGPNITSVPGYVGLKAYYAIPFGE
jgi:hypothetical protein